MTTGVKELNDQSRTAVATKRSCPLTGSNSAWVVATEDRHGNLLRNVCWTQSGFIGVDPIPIPDVSEFYKNEYRQQYKGSFVPQNRHVLRAGRCALDRYHRLKGYLVGGGGCLRTLDAGASSGEFVYLMQKLGHEAQGIEPHVGYSTQANSNLGLHVTNCTFAEFPHQQESFGLITMFHVLEHLEFPVQDLQRLRAMLGPQGVFVIEVPNILYRGMKFSHKWHKGHLNGFTATSLKVTAAMAGLEALECGEIGDGGNLFGVFRPAQTLSSEAACQLLAGHAEEAWKAVSANTNLDYYLRGDTWAKIPRKLRSQVEERSSAPKAMSAAAVLDAVYAGIA